MLRRQACALIAVVSLVSSVQAQPAETPDPAEAPPAPAGEVPAADADEAAGAKRVEPGAASDGEQEATAEASPPAAALAGQDAAAPAADEPEGAASEPLPVPQDYEGRAERSEARPGEARNWEEPPSTEIEDYYLFLPRLLLWPPNLVLKLVAMPIRGAAMLVDRYHLVEHTKDILYNDARTAGVLPTAGYQSGYGITLGLKAFHDDLFGNEEELNVGAAFGGILVQGYGFSFVGDQIAHTPLWIESRGAFDIKPGLLFHGFGNEPISDPTPGVGPREAAVATRFRETRAMGKLTVGASMGDKGDRSHVGVTGLFNHRTFGRERRDFTEPSIEEIYDTSQIPGFDEGATVFELTPTFIYDSRNFEVTTSEGVYLDVFGGHTLPVTNDASFWHYGAAFATYIDLYGGSRVLSIRTLVEAVHGRDADVPFTELMKLGGPDALRGYQLDRFRDKIRALGTLEYRYPIHQMVAGEVFLDAGRVGGTYTEVFDRDGLKDFHYGAGLGFVFHTDDHLIFKAQAAYGEELLFFLSTDPLRAFRRRHKRL